MMPVSHTLSLLLLLMLVECENHILNSKGVFNSIHCNIWIDAGHLNNDLTDVKSQINWIAHIHCDLMDLSILNGEVLLIEENELAINLDYTLVGKNVDLIPIVNKSIYEHKYHY